VIRDEDYGRPGAPRPSVLVMATDLAARNLLNVWAEYARNGEAGIPVPELLRYMRQAAEAIDYLNAHAIQHRDIKPENVLVTRDGRVKVSDFGLAKLVEGTAAVVHSGSVGLTTAYAAPELFRNTVSRRTDQYALAITCYELRCGHWPFPADSGPYQIMQAHAEGREPSTPAATKKKCEIDLTPAVRFVRSPHGLQRSSRGQRLAVA
jgi:serine/threonine protein kinase